MNIAEFWIRFDANRSPAAHAALHREYYAQCVDDSVIRTVVRIIGTDRIIGSVDPHFNDIPLRKWDAMYGIIAGMCSRRMRELNGSGAHSLSDTICIAKEVARQYVEQQTGKPRPIE